MAQVTKEQIQRARKTDLYSFLFRNHYNLFKEESGSLHPLDNHSLSIKRGYSGYKDFSTGETGNSIEFLEKYMEYTFTDAVLALTGECAASNYTTNMKVEENLQIEKLPPQFPEPIDTQYKQLYAYLMGRGISAETIKMLIGQKILYQDKHNNIIFANKERTWGERRGTNTFSDTRCVNRSECPDFVEIEHGWCKDMEHCQKYKKDAFRGMIANSRPDGFWWFQIGENVADKVYVCEASIDAISLYEIHRLDGVKENAVYVSIGGTAKQSAINRLKKKKRVILCVDNDQAGSECRKRNVDLECLIPMGKDWNDDLKARR